MSKDNRGRYTSKLNASTRQTAQLLLLKPTLHRLLRVHVHGASHLDGLEPSPFIVYSNHSSHLDAALILSALPGRLARHVATGAAADFFYDKWWKAGPMSLFFNSFPIDRPHGSRSGQGGGKGARGMAASLLSDGVPLLIFPEGTRSRTGAMGPFKPGVASLCIAHGAPAIPVALVGAYEAWPRTQKHLPRGRPHVHVVIGRPLAPKPGEIAHELNERMRRTVLEQHDVTARAYGVKTLAEYARIEALEKAANSEISDLAKEARKRAEQEDQ